MRVIEEIYLYKRSVIADMELNSNAIINATDQFYSFWGKTGTISPGESTFYFIIFSFLIGFFTIFTFSFVMRNDIKFWQFSSLKNNFVLLFLYQFF